MSIKENELVMVTEQFKTEFATCESCDRKFRCKDIVTSSKNRTCFKCGLVRKCKAHHIFYNKEYGCKECNKGKCLLI